MDWIKSLIELVRDMLGRKPCDMRPPPDPVDRQWVQVEREKVNEALRKKHNGKGL